MSTHAKENQSLVLSERPERGPITPSTFRLQSSRLPELKDGDVAVRVDYVSIDPTMRNWLNDVRSYMEPVKIGGVMRAGGIGRVTASRSSGLNEGDLVFGSLGWQEYWIGSASKVQRRQIPRGGKDIDHLGLYGSSGMTAYFGMFDIGRLKDGDTVLVSGAAGSVGMIATQIALAHRRCRVIAIAGAPEKLDQLKQLGCHDVLNYKDTDFKKKFRKLGLIDLYFDNVGGEILDLVLAQMKPYCRIVACGAISQYNAKSAYGLRNTPSLVSMKASIQGFIVFDYASRYEEARVYLSELRSKGLMKYDYYVVEPGPGDRIGLGKCVKALEDVFEGRNMGKTVVRISKDARESRL